MSWRPIGAELPLDAARLSHLGAAVRFTAKNGFELVGYHLHSMGRMRSKRGRLTQVVRRLLNPRRGRVGLACAGRVGEAGCAI
jgi:hypothetical protein